MESFLLAINYIIIGLGAVSLIVIFSLIVFLGIQRFVWWKHQDYMTYRHMRKLAQKDHKQFWEYIYYVLEKDRKLSTVDELERSKYLLEKIEYDNKEVSRCFNRENFNFRVVIDDEIKKLKEKE